MSNYDFTNIGYNSNNYYARDSRVYLIKGSQTSSTNAWTGSLPDGVADYFDGLTVDYFLPQAGTSTAATLNLSNCGAKPIYAGGTTAITTQFPQYAVIRLTYVIDSALNSGNGCWKAVSSILDTDTDNKVSQTATTTNSTYEVLFSGTADNTTRTEGARKTSTLTYNPSTKALSTGGTVNGLTLSSQTTGFKISGGSTSKALIVGADYTLGPACAKGITDNSSATPVTSTDTNLITGRTLYYAGYTKNTGTVTGTGTAGNIAKWNTSSGLTDGPAFGSDTTKFLRNDGTWQVVQTEIPVATDTIVGGFKTGYISSGNNRAVQVDSSGQAYVVQKDDDTDNKVTQNNTTSNTTYNVILSYGANSTTAATNTVNKSAGLTYNASTKKLFIGLDVDSSASESTAASSGTDKDLFNAIRNLGWYDSVII